MLPPKYDGLKKHLSFNSIYAKTTQIDSNDKTIDNL